MLSELVLAASFALLVYIIFNCLLLYLIIIFVNSVTKLENSKIKKISYGYLLINFISDMMLAHIKRTGCFLVFALCTSLLILTPLYHTYTYTYNQHRISLSTNRRTEAEISGVNKSGEITPENKTFGGVANFRYPKRLSGLSKYDEDTIKKLNVLIEREAPGDDAELVSLVKTLIDAPSDESVVKMSRGLFKTPQAESADELLSQKVTFYFI